MPAALADPPKPELPSLRAVRSRLSGRTAARCGRGVVALVAGLVALAPVVAGADPVTLRLATIAPEGTAWARELGAFAREVASTTNGALRIKIYYAGIAGDEFTVLERIKRDQLDGIVGSEICLHVSPSMRVTRIVGLFQSREESQYVMTRLKPTIDAEFLRAGFSNLGEATLGPEVLFTRQPVRDLGELRKTTLWIWDLDDALRDQGAQLGLHVVPRPIEQAARAYDESVVDGFIAIPTGALAWQWSAQARYLEDLRVSFRTGCLVFASRAFDALPIESQQQLRSASAKLRARIEDLGRRQDDELLGGLLARQGLQNVAVSERFRSEFFDAAREARTRRPSGVVPAPLVQTVLSWLADYRAEHSPAR
jgi:TRAP-type C4-dicarboxylate transport system substrate-binding protein